MTRQKMTFLILPVGLQCNLACRYCYHGTVAKKSKRVEKMSDDVLLRIMHDAQEFQSDVDFLWHGGEPLLAGIDHFQRAIRHQREVFSITGGPTVQTRNIIQSNLTLLDQSMRDFFTEAGFVLSTSIDGGIEVHDANRVYCDGKGTHKRVIEAVSMWRQTGNPIGVVALVTKDNVHIPEETLRELKATGITSCNFHFCAQDEACAIREIPSQADQLSFFKRVFDLWMEEDDPDFPIRNFRNVLRCLCGGRPLDCTSNVNGCFGFMAITNNGDVYPCHRYVERPGFCIGNILEKRLLEIYERAAPIYRELCSVNEECERCEWLGTCGNGCAFERLTMSGSFGNTAPECQTKKELFGYIKEKAGHLLG